MPERIQRKRTKGWRMPKGVIYVGRGSRWGNPFAIGERPLPDLQRRYRLETVESAEQAVDLFRRHLINTINHQIEDGSTLQVLLELRGKDLACWCPLDQPCHADVLLELANTPMSKQHDEQMIRTKLRLGPSA